MLPHFLCIGAQKAGTSWLFNQLQEHPAIWMPPVKELHFFDHLFVAQNRRWTTWHIHQGVRTALKYQISNFYSPDWAFISYLVDLASSEIFTEAWYRRAFARRAAEGKVLGDVTPEYSTLPVPGLRYVRALLGAVKVIYIIRDPVHRALSQLRMNASRRKSGDLSEADWCDMAEDREIDNRGDYRAYVPRWREHWAESDLLFIPYGRIGSDPNGVMREIEGFLGLPPHEYPRADQRIHSTEELPVPARAIELLEARLAPQRAFLETAFDPSFVRQI